MHLRTRDPLPKQLPNLMNLKQYISPQYLFTFNSANISPQEKLFFIFGAVLVLLAIVIKISAVLAPSPVDAKFRNKFYKLFLTVGLGEVLWYGFRYENVKFFATPFVALFIVAIGLVWFVALLIGLLRRYKTDKQIWEKEQVKLRYLPK